MKEVKRNQRMGLVESGVREPFFLFPAFSPLRRFDHFPSTQKNYGEELETGLALNLIRYMNAFMSPEAESPQKGP